MCYHQAIMLTWCYLAAVLVDPGQVPPGWHPFPDDAVSMAAALGQAAATALTADTLLAIETSSSSSACWYKISSSSSSSTARLAPR
jgi:hypothetical protein